MILWVGLGNPGPEYALNRHNVGFQVLDVIAATYSFPAFKRHRETYVTEGMIDSQKVTLLKPLTYMNRSGIPVQEFAGFYKIPLDQIMVFHDELDLILGKLKIKQGGGAGGHNGLRSLDAHLGNAYKRLRIGIGHPGHRDAVASYVLQNFTKQDMTELSPVLQAIADEAAWLIRSDGPRFLNEIALRLA